jgi:peptide/nickel transport system permease protein
MSVPSLEQTESIDRLAAVPSADFEVAREVGYYQLVWRRLRRHRPAMIASLVLVMVAAACFVLAPSPPPQLVHRTIWPGLLPGIWDQPDLLPRFIGPAWPHLMGTDELGRDILYRVLSGGQISIMVGVGATIVTIALGVTIGAVTGYFGGFIDNALMRVTDAMLSIPFLIVAIALAAFLGPSLANAMLAIGIAALPTFVRLSRGTVLGITTEEYIEAARAMGCSHVRIAVGHILPNMVPPLLIQSSITVAAAIIAEASLSFLGLGQQPPAPSWGSMLNAAQRYLSQAPWMALYPGLMIFVIVMAFNVLGDGLRDALDPKR